MPFFFAGGGDSLRGPKKLFDPPPPARSPSPDQKISSLPSDVGMKPLLDSPPLSVISLPSADPLLKNLDSLLSLKG